MSYSIGSEQSRASHAVRGRCISLCRRTQTGNDTVSFQYTESGKEKKEDSIITRKSIVCARKVLQNIMESGTNFTRRKHFGTLDWGRGVWTYDNTWYSGFTGTAM